MDDNFNIQTAVADLNTRNVTLYLCARGWQQKKSRREDRFYFEAAIDDSGDPCQLHLPASPRIARYGTLLLRAIYLLSGIEDREPHEIISDILAHEKDSRHTDVEHPSRRIRVRNVSALPLQLKVTSREGEHRLLSGESVELICESEGTLDVEHSETCLTIRDQKQEDF